jgi:hypothetical protein
MGNKRTPAEPKPTYAEWGARCAALLKAHAREIKATTKGPW